MRKKKEKLNKGKENKKNEKSQSICDGSLQRNKSGNTPKNNKMSLIETESGREKLLKSLEKNTKGLIYISETDAEFSVFKGNYVETVTGENLLSQLGLDADTFFEEFDPEDFFKHPTTIQDWFNEERVEIAKQYMSLKKLLEDNLSDLKVIKIGKVNLKIYIIGFDFENSLIGIKTTAVET